MSVRSVLVATLAVAAPGCGEPAPAVRLAPIDRPCGKVTDPRALLVTPLGAFTADRQLIDPGGPVALDALPDGTRQLAVEVVGDGGVISAIGKTAPFELAALVDGEVLTVAMAPPDGVCPAGTLTVARDHAAVAAVGSRVLILGGVGPGQLASAELYDPDTETSQTIAVPSALVQGGLGLAGAALATLPDGRVALVGGPQPGLAVFDPTRAGFEPPVLTGIVRAHHAAIALDDRRVLLIGGCSALTASGACMPGAAATDTVIVDIFSGAASAGPSLLDARFDPTAVWEAGRDGLARVVVVGGRSPAGAPVTSGQRMDPQSGAVDRVDGLGDAVALLDSGALLTGFAPDGATPSATVAVLVPGLTAARPLASAPARAGARLIALEDGHVLAVGGGPAVRFAPASSSWRGLVGAADLDLEGGAGLVRLADGSVLVIGGRRAGAASDRIWRLRPRLLGPFTSAQSVVPNDTGSEPALTPLDPARVTVGARWQVEAGAWAVVGGMVGRDLRLDWTGGLPAEGAALLFGYLDAGHHHRAELVPGQPVTVIAVDGGEATVLCRGEPTPAVGPTVIRVELTAEQAVVRSGGRSLVRCALSSLADGRVGVGAIGAGAVSVETLAVTR